MSESDPVSRAIKAWCDGDDNTLDKAKHAQTVSECARQFINSRERVSQTVRDATENLVEIRFNFESVHTLWSAVTKVVLLMLAEILDGPFIEGKSFTYDTGKVKVLLERIETEEGPVYSIGSYREDISECIPEYYRSLQYRFIRAIPWRVRDTSRISLYGYPDPTHCFQDNL